MPNSFLFLIKWTAWFWHHSTTIYYYYSPISWKFLLFMQRVICNRWVQIHNRLKMCMQVMNLYSYTIIDTCSCKKKKKEFCSKKCACVCPDFKSPPAFGPRCVQVSARVWAHSCCRLRGRFACVLSSTSRIGDRNVSAPRGVSLHLLSGRQARPNATRAQKES